MHEYEIRILNDNGKTALVAAEIQLSDHAAIRSAKKLANGRKVEVWRGIDCIYSDGSAPAPPPRPSHSPAA
jgi:hypothetical protein